MSKNGYVYVLINPSLPGLVKVGKTTRDVEARAKELSSATGVPTPFVAAYEVYTEDCDSLERMVHTYLGEMGVRVSQNREFFEGSVTQAVNALIDCQGRVGQGISANFDTSDTTTSLDFNSVNRGGEQLFEEGLNYYSGSDGYIEDEKQAIKCFRNAIKLGHLGAYPFLAHCYHGENKVEILLEGAKKGCVECWLDLAEAWSPYTHGIEMYAGIKVSQKNRLIAFTNFFNGISPEIYDETGDRLYPILRKFVQELERFTEPEVCSAGASAVQNFGSRFSKALSRIQDADDRKSKISALSKLVGVAYDDSYTHDSIDSRVQAHSSLDVQEVDWLLLPGEIAIGRPRDEFSVTFGVPLHANDNMSISSVILNGAECCLSAHYENESLAHIMIDRVKKDGDEFSLVDFFVEIYQVLQRHYEDYKSESFDFVSWSDPEFVGSVDNLEEHILDGCAKLMGFWVCPDRMYLLNCDKSEGEASCKLTISGPVQAD